MRRINLIWFLVILMFPKPEGVAQTGGRGKKPSTAPKADIVRIVDSARRTVDLPKPVTRAIVVYTQLLLAMKAIGVEDDQIVGLDEFTRSQYRDVLPAVKNKPVVGRNLFSLDVEKIMSLDAQVIMVTPTTLKQMPNLETQLGKVGMKVVCLDFDMRGVNDVLDVLGKMFGKQDRAAEFSRFWFSKLELVRDRISQLPEANRVSVYWENTNTPFDTINKSSQGAEILIQAGGRNIAHDIVGTKVDAEWVVARNPDFIIKYPMGAAYQGGLGQTDVAPFQAMREEIMRRPGFNQIKAVQNGQVYIVSQLMKTGLFGNVAVCCLAKILYPELFADLNPEAHFEEMARKYLGLDLAVIKGVLVYPVPWRR